MSALGQKQTSAMQTIMSALPPKADMCGATRYARFVHSGPEKLSTQQRFDDSRLTKRSLTGFNASAILRP